MPVSDEAANWLHEAKADLKHARDSIGLLSYNWACFAAHQAAEKALRAVLLHLGGARIRGHDLVKLYRAIPKEHRFPVDLSRLARLSSYFVSALQPSEGLERPSEEFSEELAREAVELAELIVREAEKLLRDP